MFKFKILTPRACEPGPFFLKGDVEAIIIVDAEHPPAYSVGMDHLAVGRRIQGWKASGMPHNGFLWPKTHYHTSLAKSCPIVVQNSRNTLKKKKALNDFSLSA
jgi:hypothetical protein